MVPIRTPQDVRKKSGAVKNSGCRTGGFAIRVLDSTDATGSSRLFASKGPSTVPLRSKITGPFQLSQLARRLGRTQNLRRSTGTPQPIGLRCTNLSKDKP